MIVRINEIVIKKPTERVVQKIKTYYAKLNEDLPDSANKIIKISEKTITSTIIGELRSGKKISLINLEMFDFQEYIDKEVDLLIFCGDFELIDLELNPDVDTSYHTIHKGILHQTYRMPSIWKRRRELYKTIAAIETTDGIILLSEWRLKMEAERILKGNYIENGEIIAIDARSHSISDWLPV